MQSLAGHLHHPQRLLLAGEIHARPFLVIDAPARISHLAIHRPNDPTLPTRLINAFCQRFGVAAPAEEAPHFSHDFGHFHIKWERHTEFATISFVEPGAHDGDFSLTVTRHIPADWLEMLDGALIVAAHLLVEAGDPLRVDAPRLARLFPALPRVGSRVLVDGEIWTDYQIGPDGFSTFLVRDLGLRESQMGRLVQRVCEIENYRMMALLALPLARQSVRQLDDVESALTELGSRMSRLAPAGDGQELLQEIARLDTQLRALAFATAYRFSAAQAYYRIVGARINELREQRIEGVPTIGEFMERRLGPAMETCHSVAARQELLASRINRSNDMLRTRVSLAQEQQTQHILHNLERSAKRQLRLQQSVEGLSVVAISYYGIGLAAYALKAFKGVGIDLPVDLATGLLLPVIATTVWFGIRRLHRDHSP